VQKLGGRFQPDGYVSNSTPELRYAVDPVPLGMREIIGRAGIVKKHKKKRFEAGKEARRRARASGIAPAATRVIPDKRKRPPKHKGDLLEGET
jgi:hypothetical protein